MLEEEGAEASTALAGGGKDVFQSSLRNARKRRSAMIGRRTRCLPGRYRLIERFGRIRLYYKAMDRLQTNRCVKIEA